MLYQLLESVNRGITFASGGWLPATLDHGTLHKNLFDVRGMVGATDRMMILQRQRQSLLATSTAHVCRKTRRPFSMIGWNPVGSAPFNSCCNAARILSRAVGPA